MENKKKNDLINLEKQKSKNSNLKIRLAKSLKNWKTSVSKRNKEEADKIKEERAKIRTLINETREKKRAIHLGTKMWTNGIINKKCKKCPGKGWRHGLTLSEKELNRRREYMKNMERKPFTEAQYENNRLAIEVNKIKVRCIELNKVFDSLKSVQTFFNLNYNKVKECCEDQNKTWKGYHWEYV